jgi:hypothetical protein
VKYERITILKSIYRITKNTITGYQNTNSHNIKHPYPYDLKKNYTQHQIKIQNKKSFLGFVLKEK